MFDRFIDERVLGSDRFELDPINSNVCMLPLLRVQTIDISWFLSIFLLNYLSEGNWSCALAVWSHAARRAERYQHRSSMVSFRTWRKKQKFNKNSGCNICSRSFSRILVAMATILITTFKLRFEIRYFWFHVIWFLGRYLLRKYGFGFVFCFFDIFWLSETIIRSFWIDQRYSACMHVIGNEKSRNNKREIVNFKSNRNG